MAQPLQNISLLAPAFKGLNTQESPVQLDPSFATVANNCVIDKSGRLASRKGYVPSTSDVTALGGNGITAMIEFIDSTGGVTFLSTGNNKIFSGKGTLTDITPSGYTPTGDDWDIVSFNNAAYFFQKDHEPLIYSAGTLQTFTSASATGTYPEANVALAAFGRIWAADETNDSFTLYWSDLLNGTTWTGGGGSAGSLNLRTVWPRGYDEIVSVNAHNNFLIIFGKESILVYEGAEDPATMSLVDTIVDIGCVSRDTVKVIGTDVLFLSQEGVRSLGRTIQEKSVGIGDISQNIKDDMIGYIQSGLDGCSATFSPADNLYLVSFPESDLVVAFDTRQRLENGALRATTWGPVKHTAYFTAQDGTLYIGNADGISTYGGYLDNLTGYELRFKSPLLTFGDDHRLKFLKKISAIFTGGGSTQASIQWSYGYSGGVISRPVTLGSGINTTAFYNESEFSLAEFGGSLDVVTTELTVNASGSGEVVSLGVVASIQGFELGIQAINLQTLIGRMI